MCTSFKLHPNHLKPFDTTMKRRHRHLLDVDHFPGAASVTAGSALLLLYHKPFDDDDSFYDTLYILSIYGYIRRHGNPCKNKGSLLS